MRGIKGEMYFSAKSENNLFCGLLDINSNVELLTCLLFCYHLREH